MEFSDDTSPILQNSGGNSFTNELDWNSFKLAVIKVLENWRNVIIGEVSSENSIWTNWWMKNV